MVASPAVHRGKRDATSLPMATSSKLREDWFGVSDNNPKIRDVAARKEVVHTEVRTDAENLVTASMPGDDVYQHPMYTEPNPYLYEPYFILKEWLKIGNLTDEDARLVRQALWLQSEGEFGDGIGTAPFIPSGASSGIKPAW
jgi:hypothetical protein